MLVGGEIPGWSLRLGDLCRDSTKTYVAMETTFRVTDFKQKNTCHMSV